MNNNGEVGGGGPVVAQPRGQNRLIPVLFLSPPAGFDGFFGEGLAHEAQRHFWGGGVTDSGGC